MKTWDIDEMSTVINASVEVGSQRPTYNMVRTE